MTFKRTRQLHVIALATMFAAATSASVFAQESPTTLPATVPSAMPSAMPIATPGSGPATAPSNGSGNGALHGVTTQPGGGLLLNFKDAGIDAVLDELSAAAGFIVVKEVKRAGRVTLVSKQAVSKEDAVGLLNTVLRNAG